MLWHVKYIKVIFKGLFEKNSLARRYVIYFCIVKYQQTELEIDYEEREHLSQNGIQFMQIIRKWLFHDAFLFGFSISAERWA